MSKRDSSLFTPNTLPRSFAGQLARTGSHESLTAHPLLSSALPGSSSSSISSTGSSQTDIASSPISTPLPRYVPYTPRQRPGVAVGTTMHSTVQASPQHHPFQGDATSKLQLMNLKAAAQTGGLDSASTGWAILEKLGTETDHGPEWNEMWSALSNSKATLILPIDPHPANEPISASFLKDHIAICDGSSRKHAPFITLSGLRGVLDDEILVFRSSLSPTSKHFEGILNPTTRSSAFATLPPLPPVTSSTESSADRPSSAQSSPSRKFSLTGPSKLSYPTYTLPLHHSSLPLPPRPPVSGTSPSKPPLPPRPTPRAASHPVASTAPQSVPQAAASRLSSSFASLFGRAASPTPPGSPIVTPLTLQADQHAPEGHTEPGLGVPAFTISTRIVHKDIAKGVLKTLHNEIRAELDGVPSWIIERVEDFINNSGLLPFIKIGKNNKASGGTTENVPTSGYTLAPDFTGEDGIEELGRKFQEFYFDLEEELFRRKWRMGRQGFSLHLNGGSGGSGDEKEKDNSGEEKEAEDQGGDEKEKRVREVLERVERTMCTMLYDRLFLQSYSDDASHDEALSSRIAAVNLLDLSLAHLGVDVGDSGVEVDAVVRACGETLSQLDSACRAPADKAAVLVVSHKIIVDGLSRLPPIRLKSDEERADEKLPARVPLVPLHTRDTSSSGDQSQEMGSIPPIDSDKTIVLEDTTKLVLSPETTTPPAAFAVGNNAHANSSSDTTPSVPLTLPTAADESSKPSATNLTTSSSPKLTIYPAPPANPTPVSGDIILPLMIFAVVKNNPPHLVSHLLYTQRFRNQGVGGEESYCLINLLAVAEFLENVDLAALGLSEKEKMVLSTAELTPIPVTRASQPPSPRSVQQPSLRGRVEQQVDAIAGSANKVISGVVDTSFGVLRALLPGTPNPNTHAVPTGTGSAGAESGGGSGAAAAVGSGSGGGDTQESTSSKAGFGLLRRDTGFSIASLAASIPVPGASRAKKDEETSGQQLLEVPSRPGSSRSIRISDASSAESDEDEEDEDDDGAGSGADYEEQEYDSRSIRSFESMMSARNRAKGGRRKKGRPRMNSSASTGGTGGRKSLADRLASVPGLSRLSGSAPGHSNDPSRISPPTSRRSSLLLPPITTTTSLASQTHSSHHLPRPDTPLSSRGASPVAIRISPPNPRFLECTVDDIKVSEVGELLKECKRLAEAVRAMGGFHDE